MKKIIFLLLFFCNSIYSQSTFNYQTPEKQLEYFRSNASNSKDGFGNSIFRSIEYDSLILYGNIYSEFGWSVSSAGDVNGDGYSDVIVGAYGYNNYTGRAYVYYGGLTMDSIADVTFTGEAVNNDFGWSVSSAGDVNGDGYSDVIVGAPNSSIDRTYIFKIESFIRIKLKILMEGMYSPIFNQLSIKDSITVFLREVTSPYILKDSARMTIDTISFTGLFKFFNASHGTYYISVNHLNSIETWSKVGGELLTTVGTIYNYDFTSAFSQAYGNNLKLKGSKYCLFSGDINQDGYISLFDVLPIYNDASNFVTGRYIKTDLTGDGLVDLTDVTLCYNNSSSFVSIIRP